MLGARQRWLAGVVGLGLGVGVPFVASVVLVARTGDPVFVIFPLPFLGLVWVIQAFAPSGYALDDDAVVVERRRGPWRIPLAAIAAVDRVPRPVGGLLALGVNGLFGAHGARWNRRTGLHHLAITNTDDLVYLHTRGGLVVISPSRPDAFVAALEARRAAAAPPGTADGRARGA